jgi:acyl carrier protein
VKSVTAADVRLFLTDFVARKSEGRRDSAGDLSDDCDLLLSGLIDSLGLLELVIALGNHFGSELDLEDLDPEEMTIVGPLSRYVAKQLNEE